MSMRPTCRILLFALLLVVLSSVPGLARTADGDTATQPTITRDKDSYLPGETIFFTGSHWAPGETITVFVSNDPSEGGITVHATADDAGSFSATATMPDADAGDPDRPLVFTATASGLNTGSTAQAQFTAGHAPTDGDRILQMQNYWNHRLTYPTGKFNPKWVRDAAKQDARIRRGRPGGRRRQFGQRNAADAGTGSDLTTLSTNSLSSSATPQGPLFSSSNSFIALGPAPEHMTGCSGCYDYGTTSGRTNDIVVDPTTTTNGSIVAYAATVGGGVWKTTNCCSANTTWSVTTDDPLIATTAIDTLTIDPSNHNTIYAGTGDLNFGSFSMGSQGILKSTDGGSSWSVLGADVFGPNYVEAVNTFPQYDAVGKVRVDPNNSNNVMAGSKKGLWLSNDGGATWTNCPTNSFTSQRQDITGLELTNVGNGVTRVIAAIGTRGFATPVQPDLGNTGANGIYRATLPASGCPTFTLVSRNDNGFVFGTQVSGSPYTTGAAMNAGSGSPWASTTSGNQLSRIDIAVAPSDPNTIYAQVGSIAPNSSSGCGNANGCQLGAWASTDGGDTWTFMAGSSGASLRACATGGTSGTGSGTAGGGDYNQNWYDQGVAVDPNNPDRVFFNTFDTWVASRTGTQWYNITCGYSGTALSAHTVHVDHHAQTFVPGNSDIFLNGGDGGVHGTTGATAAVINTSRPTWFNMDGGFNTIEFYSGDISGNFATSNNSMAAGGAQDNGPSSVTFATPPTGPAMWQMGTGGDGFYARIDPVGTGSSLRVWLGNNSGGLSRCISNCSNPGATWSSKRGAWTSDTQSFILPFDLFHGGIPGGDDCPAAASNGGCGRLLAGTTRVFETITGNAANSNGTVTWVVTNNPTNFNMTKQSLGNRSYINQVKYSPKWQSSAIVGTNDANVWIGFNLGTGVAAQANWVNVTGANAVLPNRPVLGIALDPTTTLKQPIGYAAIGGFNDNTPSQPGHVYRVVCGDTCSSFTWTDKSGNLPNIPVDSIIVNPNFPQQVFAGTDFGLYFTDDITAQSPVWQRFSNLPAVMIWDMQIDRGATTLSLWTRGRGAYAWALPLGPEQPLPTTLTSAPATGTYAGTATLSATLISGGNPVAGKTVNFTINSNSVGSAVTDANGVATLSASLGSIQPGTYPGAIKATFDGDNVYAPASATSDLTVTAAKLIATATLAKQGDGSYTATVSIKNSGNGAAQGVVLTTATLGSASGTPLPQSLPDIPAGGTVTTTVTFPASAGNSGTGSVERFAGTFTGGSFATSLRVVLPN